MKKLFVLFIISLLLIGCKKEDAKPTDTREPTKATEAPTKAPEATPTPVPEEYTPADPFDEEGRVIAVYGTPLIDGIIDPIWDKAGIIIPERISSPNIKATGEFKVCGMITHYILSLLLPIRILIRIIAILMNRTPWRCF